MWKPSFRWSSRKDRSWQATQLLKEAPREGRELSPAEWTHAIKQEAFRLGFSAAGVAPPFALTARRPDLISWLKSGYAGSLGYMQNFLQRQKSFMERTGAIRSVLVLAAPYPPDVLEDSPKPSVPSGRISRYAAGRDYHRVLGNRLKALETFIRKSAGVAVHLCRSLDTAPVQEKVLAEAAGIGFFGKNSCLIRPKGGSYFFLAALLTDLELPPDPPLTWDCGSCTLCMEACPTQAIPAAYQVDASRCISALTIELKGVIEPSLRPLLKDWLFGCDVCQEVCPYNRLSSPPSGSGDFGHPTVQARQISLETILGCRDEAQFRALFSGSPLTRTKREGLLRNAAVAAGNSLSRELIPALSRCLRQDPSPIIRQHAAWALGQFSNTDAYSALKECLEGESNPAVLEEVRFALNPTLEP